MSDKCSTCGHLHRSDDDTKVCTLLSCMCDITKFQPEIETQTLDYYQSVLKTFTKVADKVQYLLTEIPEFRNLNNKEFLFAYWHYNFGFCPGMKLEVPVYHKLTDSETIRRCKQKVVEENPELAASSEVASFKGIKKTAIEEWITQC